ncbi:protein TASOR-like isoform X4 [Biomphalaria pfeifferi]|uniref:Protein TASOR-like isoform X4 n=1 Tax=Biomphalaria pfeifferi TaxID=112525 RepID=A0AAD8F8I7_BIOPF|nr:protein TASOR-like isoform X4 [Biomphalaria pfeifferi]
MDGLNTFKSKPEGGTTKRKLLLKSNVPKLKKIKQDFLTDLTLDSHECHDILAPVRKSFHFPVSSSYYEFTKVQAIFNPVLSAKYMERRREMILAGYSNSQLAEMFAFIPVENLSKVERFCQEGIRCGNQQFSGLGVSHMAVHLCKHADIVYASRPKVGEKILLVVKTIKGKMKTVLCKNVGVQLKPTPNYDCHIAKPNVDQATQLAPHMLLYTTQIFVYEYSDFKIVDHPRQVLPYAVVFYINKEPQPVIPKPITSTPQSHPMSSVVPPLSSTQRSSSSETDEGMSTQLKNIVQQVISGYSRPSDNDTTYAPSSSNNKNTTQKCVKIKEDYGRALITILRTPPMVIKLMK